MDLLQCVFASEFTNNIWDERQPNTILRVAINRINNIIVNLFISYRFGLCAGFLRFNLLGNLALFLRQFLAYLLVLLCLYGLGVVARTDGIILCLGLLLCLVNLYCKFAFRCLIPVAINDENRRQALDGLGSTDANVLVYSIFK